MASNDPFSTYLIKKHARASGVPENEILGIGKQETGYLGLKPTAVSPAGARGALQVMPGTAKRHVSDEEYGTAEGQIKAGVLEYKRLRDKYQDPRKAIRGYHGGEGAINNPRSYDPYARISTNDYERNVMRNAGLDESDTPSSPDPFATYLEKKQSVSTQPVSEAQSLVNELTAANPQSRIPAPARTGVKGAGERQLSTAVPAVSLDRQRPARMQPQRPVAKLYQPSSPESQLQRFFEEAKASGDIASANKYGSELKEKYGWSFGTVRAPAADGSLYGQEWPYIKPPGSQGIESKPSQGTESFINQGVANREATERRARIKAQQDAKRQKQGIVANVVDAVKEAGEGAAMGLTSWAGDRVAGAGRLIETVTDAMRPPMDAGSEPVISGRDARLGESVKEAGEKAATVSREYLSDFGQSIPSQGGALVGELAPDLLLSAATGAPAATFGTSSALSSYGQGKPLAESILTGVVNARGMEGGNVLAAELEQLAKGSLGKYAARATAQGLQNVGTNAAMNAELPDTPEKAAKEILFALGFGLFPANHPKADIAAKTAADIASHPETHPAVAAEIQKAVASRPARSAEEIRANAQIADQSLPASAEAKVAAADIPPLPEVQPMVAAQNQEANAETVDKVAADAALEAFLGRRKKGQGEAVPVPEAAPIVASLDEIAPDAIPSKEPAPPLTEELADLKVSDSELFQDKIDRLKEGIARTSHGIQDAQAKIAKGSKLVNADSVRQMETHLQLLKQELAEADPSVDSPTTEGQIIAETPQTAPTAKKILNERRKAERERDTDTVTGLQSQGAYKRAEGAISADPSRAIVAIDLNSFKAVNDTYGHAAGDRVLKNYADELMKAVPSAQMIARSGGDEMRVVVDAKDAQKATDIIKAIKVREGEIDVTGSVGHGLTELEADAASNAHKQELKAAGVIGANRGEAPPVQATTPKPTKKKSVAAGTDIIQAIRDKGGIDMGSQGKGEQKRLRESRLKQPGVFNSGRDKNGNRKGMTFDEMARELYSEGYLTDPDPRNHVNEMFEKLDRAAAGERILSMYDEGAAIEQQKVIDDEWDAWGLGEDLDEVGKAEYNAAVDALANQRLNDAISRIEQEGPDEGSIRQLEDVARYELGIKEDRIQDLIKAAQSRHQSNTSRLVEDGQGEAPKTHPTDSPGQRQGDVGDSRTPSEKAYFDRYGHDLSIVDEAKKAGLSTDEYARVVSLHQSLKERGVIIDDYLNQQGLFGDGLSPKQKELLRELDGKKGYGEKNRGVTKAEAQSLWEDVNDRLDKNRGSGGLSTQDIIDLSKIAAYHIEAGAREFGDFSKQMLSMVGEYADEVKPYLRQLFDEYNAKNITHHSQIQPRAEDGKFVEAKQAERATPKTLEAHGLESGSNLIYDVLGNDETVKVAKENLASKGVDGAAEFVRSSGDVSAETTATGLAAISEYQRLAGEATGKEKTALFEKANNLASDLAEKLTTAGQAIQAVKVIAKFSPERALITAQKLAEKEGRKVSAMRAEGITDAAIRIQAAEARVKELEAIVRDFEAKAQAKETSRRAKVIKALDTKAAEASARLAALNIAPRKVQTSPTQQGAISFGGPKTDPAIISDLASVLAAKVAKGDAGLADLRTELSTEFGDVFDSNYRRIEKEANAILTEANRQPKAATKTTREELRKSVSDAAKWDAGIREAAKGNPSDMAAVGASLLADIQASGKGRYAWQKEMSSKFGKEFEQNKNLLFKQAFESIKNAKKSHLELGEIRKAMEAGAITDEQIKQVRRLLETARKSHREVNLELARHYDHLAGGRVLHILSGLRKAGLLSSVRTHLRNFGGNLGYQAFDEVSRIPAVVVDFGLSAMTGQRSITGLSPSASLDSAAAAFKIGGGEFLKIMKGQDIEGQSAKLQLPEGLNSGVKVIDTAVDAVFNLMKGTDRIFYQGALKRNILDRAKVQALNEARAGEIKFRDVKDRTKKLVASPPEQLLTDAKHDAMVATFNNDNRLSSAIRRARSSFSPTANFAIDMVMPFDRTPTNIIARLLEASPVGVVKAATGGYKKSPLSVAKSVINKSMTVEEQRQFSQTMGRATTGTAILALGYKLAAAGLMTGLYDDDISKRKENRKNKEAGRQPMSVKIGNQWVQVGSLSPLGNLLAIGASLQEKESSVMEVAGRAALEQPLMRAGKDVSEAFKNEEKAEDRLGSLTGSFIPSILSDVATATDDKARKGFGFKNKIYQRLPGLRNKLPEDVGVEHRRTWAVDPFRMTTDRPSKTAAGKY